MSAGPLGGAGGANLAGGAGVGGAAGGPGAGAGGGGSAGSEGNGGTNTSGVAAWTQSPFIMDTWFGKEPGTSGSDVERVKASGFRGFATSADNDLAGYVAALAVEQLPMVGVYTVSSIDGYPTGVVDTIASTDGWIWLAINGAPHPTSDPAGDTAALALIGKLADECVAKGLPGVALYPHIGHWMERVGDAVRLAAKAARPDVGVVFNQFHWMAADSGQDLEGTLAMAAPYLKFVTINGSEANASILPLGEGAYDVLPIFKALTALNFAGSVGLQGFSIEGDIDAKLVASKQEWDALAAQASPL